MFWDEGSVFFVFCSCLSAVARKPFSKVSRDDGRNIINNSVGNWAALVPELFETSTLYIWSKSLMRILASSTTIPSFEGGKSLKMMRICLMRSRSAGLMIPPRVFRFASRNLREMFVILSLVRVLAFLRSTGLMQPVLNMILVIAGSFSRRFSRRRTHPRRRMNLRVCSFLSDGSISLSKNSLVLFRKNSRSASLDLFARRAGLLRLMLALSAGCRRAKEFLGIILILCSRTFLRALCHIF